MLASDVLKKAKNVVYLGTMLDCLNEVKLEKVDAAIVDEPIARFYFKKNNKVLFYRKSPFNGFSETQNCKKCINSIIEHIDEYTEKERW